MSQLTGELSFSTITVVRNVVTVGSTTAVWPGQIGYLNNTGLATLRVAVVSVTDATHFVVKAEPKINDDNFMKGTLPAYPGNSAADFTTYNGGGIYFPSQVVPTQQDNTKLPTFGG